jgi:hydrogenase nickel incorporation protein HypA/HybF
VHELAISQSILNLVADVARQHGGLVRKVVVLIGPLSGVEAASLARAYPIAAAGTVADGSELVIETADVVVRCRGCGASTPRTANRLVCGTCGDWHTDLTSGNQLLLLRVELTQPDPLYIHDEQEADADV